ncbi:MAG TPA: hypothetical protein VN700_12555 [Vicinamibacterales bacterium]|nr:hypothetical protein [Vicinamibacterales bacterium]
MPRPFAGTLIATALLAAAFAAQQRPDLGFDVSVAAPAYVKTHPRVVIDEAHNNFHTAEGRYKPFATLLRNDGCDVRSGTSPFTRASLAGVDVLVVSNALGPGATVSDDSSSPAFTVAESASVAEWVRAGGSLLLISDHTPMGEANAALAATLGVTMGKGFVMTTEAPERSTGPAQLVFSRANGLLGDHPITRGRNERERIETVTSFTGQSLSVLTGGVAILVLGSGAWEMPTRTDAQALGAGRGTPTPAALSASHAVKVSGRAQGVAFELGKGRVVVLGEAAMMSAQISGANGEGRMGMNVPGNQDKQFALNVLHWLTRLL